jgi:hypothetical protein
MNNEINWSNIFFFILVTIIILSLITWFFGWSIPNYKGIKQEVVKKTIETDYIHSQSCSEAISGMTQQNYIKMYGNGTEVLELLYKGVCGQLCTSKSDSNNLVYLTYQSYKCNNNILTCSCKVMSS